MQSNNALGMPFNPIYLWCKHSKQLPTVVVFLSLPRYAIFIGGSITGWCMASHADISIMSNHTWCHMLCDVISYNYASPIFVSFVWSSWTASALKIHLNSALFQNDLCTIFSPWASVGAIYSVPRLYSLYSWSV